MPHARGSCRRRREINQGCLKKIIVYSFLISPLFVAREGARMFAAAADRNKQPILEVLQKHLQPVKEPAVVLEVSSGTGQHVAHVAPHFPDLVFQPTELDSRCIESIREHIKSSGATNVREPQLLDATTPCSEWLGGTLLPGSLSAIININMIHISSGKAVEGLFTGAGALLSPGGRLITYGPYAVNGVITPDSNVNFDAHLRSMNPDWHLRDIELDLKPLAQKNGLSLLHIVDMPANNKTLIWQKRA